VAQRILLEAFGGLYNDLVRRKARLGAAAVIFDGEGRVLLVRHSYGRRGWELPGGGREPKESVEQTVYREVREELGVTIVEAQLCGVYYEADVDQHHFAFRCRLADGAQPKTSSPEILECRYAALEELPRPMTDFTLRRITDAQSPPESISVTVLPGRGWLD
jgi:8-oxo-dGTP diphosphatase